jgi:bacteriocin-like protein
MNTNSSGELCELSTDELRTVEGGSLRHIFVWYLRDLLTKGGDAPGEQETFIVSLSPSQNPP